VRLFLRLTAGVAIPTSRAVLHIPVGLIKCSLNTNEEVEIVVDTGGSGEVAALDKCSGIPLPRALGALLVPFVARERARASGAAGAPVHGFLTVAAPGLGQ